jgi:ArsR family transcriptional regulator
MEKTNQEKDSDVLTVRDEELKKILEQQPDDEILYDLAELFKVFGDSTRIKILYALSASELCVGDIAQLLNLSQSSVSHQLRILKDSKLVRFRREGKSVFYALDDEHVRNIINMGMEHVEE